MTEIDIKINFSFASFLELKYMRKNFSLNLGRSVLDPININIGAPNKIKEKNNSCDRTHITIIAQLKKGHKAFSVLLR